MSSEERVSYRDKLAKAIRETLRTRGHELRAADAALAVRDAELDRLSQENDRLRNAHTGVACWESDALWDQERRRAESAEAQLAEAEKKIANLSARFTGVKIHALRLRERITDPEAVTVLDDLFGALTNPPHGDTP